MPLPFRRMETRRLHGSEIIQIVRVLRNDISHSSGAGEPQYEKATQCAIKRLPRRLRSTLLSSHGLLCCTHKGLDVHLLDDIWAWIKFELEIAVGRFLYPIVMTDLLSRADEYRVRQLEPVVEMFLPKWTLAASAPPGKQPIDTGSKWAFQENGCPACMLARIGSDEAVLFALFAVMYGHLRPRSGGQKSLDTIKSKRLRFIRYWMRTHPNGDHAAQEAYDLGVKLKTLRPDAKTSLRRAGQPTHYTRDSLDEPPANPRHCLDEQPEIAVDPSTPLNPKEWLRIYSHNSPSPVPHRHSVAPYTASYRAQERASQPPQSNVNIASPRTPPTLHRHDSVLHPSSTIHPAPSSVPSISSYNALGASINNHAPRLRGHDPMETVEERVDRYRKLIGGTLYACLANGCEGVEYEGVLLPKPSRGSIYAGFGVVMQGGDVDRTPVSSPVGGEFEGVQGAGDELEGDDLLPLRVRG